MDPSSRSWECAGDRHSTVQGLSGASSAPLLLGQPSSKGTLHPAISLPYPPNPNNAPRTGRWMEELQGSVRCEEERDREGPPSPPRKGAQHEAPGGV